MKVFLAYAFRDQDRDLVADVEALFESHNVRLVTGEQLGGQALTPAVKERILESHGLKLTVADVGGSQGRKIFFYTHTGEVLLKRLTSGIFPDDII